MTDEDRKRIERIMNEATHKPPKRIYSDDALWLIEIIWELLKKLEAK